MANIETSRRTQRADRDEALARLDRLNDDLAKHKWSFTQKNFRDYIQAVRLEERFFATAMSMRMFGPEAVESVAIAQTNAAVVHANAVARNDPYSETKRLENKIEYLEKKLKETREQYMKPVDFYKEKLERHDWFYDYSDDRGVYQRGNEREQALRKEAEEGGPEFKAAWQEAVLKYRTKPMQATNDKWRAEHGKQENQKNQKQQ